MPRAIQRLEKEGKPPRTIGYFTLDLKSDDEKGWGHAVHDGDTLNSIAAGYFPVRFLGVDTPEVALQLPDAAGGSRRPTQISDALWQEYLQDPFNEKYGAFDPPLTAGLTDNLLARLGDLTALNHAGHADGARRGLISLLQADQQSSGGGGERPFDLFYAFAYEVFDRYSRLLAFVHPRQPKGETRLASYNERMLASGLGLPFFIWPNVDPFLTMPTVAEAVIKPGCANDYAETPGKLKAARDNVREARKLGMGVFDERDPLLLEAFELRYLADRRPPTRWVIDLSRRDDVLVEPQSYYEIRNVEDRLYISPEHVALFEQAGWRRQSQ